MKKRFVTSLFSLLCFCAAQAQHLDSMKWVDGTRLTLVGKAFVNTEGPFDRLPAYLKDSIRQELWDLGKNSSGLAVRFRTDSRAIGARWELLNNFHMNHMTGVGIRGLDLYAYTDGEWKPVRSAQPSGKENQRLIISNMAGVMTEYMLYLPLYDGVISLDIAVDPDAEIVAATYDSPSKYNPIVFYGTSITQGGCVSRPGMSYTSILARLLDRDVINLGFSGNGRLDYEIARAIGENLEPSVIVLDCVANCTKEMIREKGISFIEILREYHPAVPIVFVNSLEHPSARYDLALATELKAKNEEVQRTVNYFRDTKRDRNVYHIKTEGFLYDEGTVDGTHITDFGSVTIANEFYKYLRRFVR